MTSKAKKQKCWHLVEAALKSGELVRPDVCERCGAGPTKNAPLQAHHDDYDKPLDVDWLCKRCHMIHHYHYGDDGKKRDNTTFLQKTMLRQRLLAEMKNPVVMETHGGAGRLFSACYEHLPVGIVFEKDPDKAAVLGLQRPTWLVYECDCLHALSAGVGAHLAPSFFDLDPYGDPWPIITRLFDCGHYRPDRLALVVNDGLRQKLKINGGWTVASMKNLVSRHGNNALYGRYVELCRENLTGLARDAGYRITRWAGYYCGHGKQMTHYAAVLER